MAEAFWDLRDDAFDHPERWTVTAYDVFQRLGELVEKAEGRGVTIDWRRVVVEPMLEMRAADDTEEGQPA